MKLIIQNNRIAGTATDDYTGPDAFIAAPDGFDVSRMSDYTITDGAAVLPAVDPQVLIADKIDALWRAADSYVSGYISGVAIGILTIGVIQQLPKALAVTAWSSSVWAEYYTRKALVTAESVDDLDFTEMGAMPHSVPELQAELGM